MPRQQPHSMIAVTTDFGDRDHYVACMKGVIAQVAPQSTVVDVTHEIEPQNIMGAAYILYHAFPWFPPGTIHLVVVDPGVGTARGIIAARYGENTIIAPDNGIISFVHHAYKVDEVRVINNPQIALGQVSNTFHGRDIMAPAAAHLAKGGAMRDLGPATNHVEVLKTIHPKQTAANRIEGQVIHVDRFGNLLSNISQRDLALIAEDPKQLQVSISTDGDSHQVLGRLHRTYGDVPVGEALSLLSSGGFVEVAVHLGDASNRLKAKIGSTVVVERLAV